MWIRSQDKTKLLNVKGLEICEDDNTDYGIFSHVEYGLGDILGSYSTKAKALKVLDRIQNHNCRQIVETYPDMNYNVIHDNAYQMPQDSEVQ